MEIRKVEVELTERVETGPVQFNDDWPGVFIRGDNAACYAMMLEMYLLGDGAKDPVATATMNSLLRLLQECRV